MTWLIVDRLSLSGWERLGIHRSMQNKAAAPSTPSANTPLNKRRLRVIRITFNEGPLGKYYMWLVCNIIEVRSETQGDEIVWRCCHYHRVFSRSQWREVPGRIYGTISTVSI